MRKVFLAIVGLVALAVTSVAVAHGIEGAKTANAVAATFSASAGNVTTKSCTTSDGKSITITNGTYTGTASGDTALAGAITLRARSIINTTDNVGSVSGQFKIDVSGRDTEAMFATVYSGGSLAGLATGRGDQSGFLGNLSATFAPATGFTNAKIGGGTSGGNAITFGPSSCNADGTTNEHSEARGTISAISSSSITVAGLTCAVGSDLASDVAKFATGATVQIKCTFANGQNTLTDINGKGSSGDHNSKRHH
jgi:hypothetical protein